MAIRGFASAEIERFYRTGRPPRKAGWAAVAGVATRKLDMLEYAHRLEDLRSPPANRLEAMKGNLRGLYSIRINDRWRILFRWSPEGPSDVDVVDYH